MITLRRHEPERCGVATLLRQPIALLCGVADHTLLSEVAFAELEAYSSQRIPRPADAPPFIPEGGRIVHQDHGLLGGRLHLVTIRATPAGYRLEIEGVGCFSITADGQHVTVISRDPAVSAPLFNEAVLGPALILALALHDTWCLHASAARFDGKTIAFSGDSGQGKSTLARYLGEQPGWRRVADDILPVAISGNSLDALPHFPQLKIPTDQQPAVGLPQRLPMSALYLMGDPGPEVLLEPLAPLEGAFALISSTVAARLFDRALLTHHMEFVRAAAELLPVRRLRYPRRFGALPAVANALIADMQTLTVPGIRSR
jgi:hypothetical protein